MIIIGKSHYSLFFLSTVLSLILFCSFFKCFATYGCRHPCITTKPYKFLFDCVFFYSGIRVEKRRELDFSQEIKLFYVCTKLVDTLDKQSGILIGYKLILLYPVFCFSSIKPPTLIFFCFEIKSRFFSYF